MKTANKLIIVSDLDGSLLDHHTYSYDAAAKALAEVKSLNIPLIFNTSKTASELGILRKELNNGHPFIVENGSGVIIPQDYFTNLDEDLPENNGFLLKSFGTELANVIVELYSLRTEQGVSFRGFSEMSVDDLVHLTGLSRENAVLAKTRDFSEPLVWESDKQAWLEFAVLLSRHHLKHTVGGRFIHVSGGGDKGEAVQWLQRCYLQNWGELPKVIALGDGKNDVAMLQGADIAVIIRSPVNPLPTVPNRNDVMVTEACGPAGWNVAVLKILKQLKLIN